jgi:hypothetical protein
MSAITTSAESQTIPSHTTPTTAYAWGPKGVYERNYYTQLLVNWSDVIRKWPEGSEQITLFEAATRAYEQTRDKDISILAEELTDSPDEILTWYCNRITRHYDGKQPIAKMFGNRPPARNKEEIYLEALGGYDFVVNGTMIILQERNGRSRYENLCVNANEVDAAIQYLTSLSV